jgi:signal transduction histidine kinase
MTLFRSMCGRVRLSSHLSEAGGALAGNGSCPRPVSRPSIDSLKRGQGHLGSKCGGSRVDQTWMSTQQKWQQWMHLTRTAPFSGPNSGLSHSDREAALEERIAELEQELKARDDFLAIAAHELRNPMTPIGAQIELLLARAHNATRGSRPDFRTFPQSAADWPGGGVWGRPVGDTPDHPHYGYTGVNSPLLSGPGRPRSRVARSPSARGRRRGTESLQTLRWRRQSCANPSLPRSRSSSSRSSIYRL